MAERRTSRSRPPHAPRRSSRTRRRSSESGEKLKAELDDLLDEIDEVLETNAEDFVKSYVQKGGHVDRPWRCPRIFTPGDDRGSSFPGAAAIASGAPWGPAAPIDRRHSAPSRTPRRAWPCASPTAWSWRATARATAGNLISHRTMEKVVEADRHSGVAIAGAAGPAMEMVRLFQLQLEHYEKVEGNA